MVRESSMESSAKDFVPRFAERTLERALPLPNTRAVDIDVWGREVKKEGTTLSRLAIPQRAGKAPRLNRPDKVLAAWNAQNPAEQWAPQPASRRIETNGEAYYMNDEEFVAFQKDAGARAMRLINSIPLNMAKPTQRDVDRIKNALTAAKSAARKKFRREKNFSL
jgi:hypothetical protein